MSNTTQYSFKDLFLAFGYAANRDTLLWGAGGLLVSFLITGIWTAIFSFLFDAIGWGAGLLIFNVIGLLILLAGISLTITGVAFIVRSDICGADNPNYIDVLNFIKKHVITIVLVPYAFIGILLASGLLHAVFDVIFKIPGIGSILFGILYGVLFAIGLFMVFTVIVFELGMFLYPTIIVTHLTGIVETIKKLFETVKEKWLQLIGYLIVVGFLSFIVFFVAYFIFGAAFSITTALSTAITGKNAILTTTSIVGKVIYPFMQSFSGIFGAYPGYFYGEASWFYGIGGIFQMIWMAIILSITFSYPFVFSSSAGVMVYHILMNPDSENKKDASAESEE